MKIQSIFSAILLLLPIQSLAANGAMKGDGSTAKPFQIEDYEDLKAIGKGAYLYSSNYVLTKDIDASASKSEVCNEDGCNGFIPIGKNKDAVDSTVFWGTIDGQNHTISNLNIWLPCEEDVGFVYALIGSIKNLNFDHLNVTGRVDESNHVGGVVARLVGTIENVHVTNGFVQGQKRVGGIAGCAMRTIGYSDVTTVVKNVSFQGDIKATARVGGIVGETDGATVDSAFADVNIIVLESDAGGIVGRDDGIVRFSHSSGTIVPGADEVDEVGGVVGYSKSTIDFCSSTMDLIHSGTFHFGENIGGVVGDGNSVNMSFSLGAVEGSRYVGGVAGRGSVTMSYAMGSVQGSSYVGGVVGYGSVNYSYAANVVRGDSLVGGLVGNASKDVLGSYWNTEISGLDTSAGGTGLTTAKMMKFSSFAGWDTLGFDEYVVDGTDTCDYYEEYHACYSLSGNFIHYWDIDEGSSFPYLKNHPFAQKTSVPIAVPTSAPAWQETPVVASLMDVGGTLVGKWLGWVQPNKLGDPLERDSLYYGYRIGVVVDKDTVWGTSSYMAVPNKIQISTVAELQKIGNDIAYPLVANYELTRDIDAKGFAFKPIGDSVHVFNGMFDGKNHKISNLTIADSSRDFAGLFGYTEYARISDLTLVNTKVTGSWFVGALAGEMKRTVVHNVVSLNGDISGTSFVGGLLGSARDDSLSVVAATGAVTGNDIVGGIIGASAAKIENAFSVNVIKGHENTGGVIGLSDHFETPTLQKNIYSASILKSYELHGIIGGSFFGSGENMESCYFDATIIGYTKGGNSTEEMMKKSTYVGFDFANIWEIQEGKSYPYFKGMNPILPGTLKNDSTVNILAGFGTEVNPYKIQSYSELKLVGKHEYSLDKYYKLTGNIDAAASQKENCNADSTVCKGFEPIGNFSGVFDGGNKIIAHLNINRADEDSVGLFRALAKGAKVGGIVFDTASHFGESYSFGSSNHYKGVVRGKNYVGVLAGVDNGAEIENIYVKNEVRGANYVGGVVGKKNAGSIVRSASRDTISGSEYVGGLVGSLGQGTIKDCFSVGSVMGSKDVGGLVGYSGNATVQNSYAASYVTGTSKWGGIAGEDVKSTYTSVYYDSTLWLINVTAAGELRATDEMVKKENYKDWDFDKTWRIAADTTYPYFTWICTSYYISKTMDERIRPNRYIDKTMMQMAGSGTEKDPFLVKTYGDLKSIGFGKYKMSAVYKLANDIDASASANEILEGNASKGFKPIGEIEYFGASFGNYGIQDLEPFSGKFDGNGFSINNLTMYYNRFDQQLGFIDTLAASGVIENLTFKNYSLVNSTVAGVVGANYGVVKNVHVEAVFDTTESSVGFVNYNKGSIENCTIKAKVNGSYAFAGVAYANYGKIVDVKVDVTGDMGSFAGIALVNSGLIDKDSVTTKVVSESGFMAGLVGLNKKAGSISASSATVDMTSKNGGAGYANYLEGQYQRVDIRIDGVGGLVGVDSGSVTGSTASGVIDASHSNNVGGLIGAAYGIDLKDLHTSVDVSGYDYVGGFVGFSNTKISNSYATGNVSGKGMYSTGGFVGKVDSLGVIEKSFATGNVVGAGFVGENYGLVKQSYSTGDVRGQGSFVMNNQSKIEDCYSTGDVVVVDDFYGIGFAGINGNGAKVRAFATGTAVKNGVRYCGGLPKYTEPSDENYYLADNCSDSLVSGKGLSLSEIRQLKSFAGFDFDSVWYIKEGATYPLLRGLPNVPVAGSNDLTIDEKLLVKDVRQNLLDMAFVMDSSYAKVVMFDSTSEKLLDSLEKAGKSAGGEFEITYRIGMLLEKDTVWGSPVLAKINLSGRTGVVVQAPRKNFGATLKGSQVALRFETPAAGAVKFSLVDMQGRTARTFDLGHRAAGAYFETLDVAELGRGRYVGILQVGGKAVEKALLLKK